MQHLTVSHGKILIKNNTETIEERDNKVVYNCYTHDHKLKASYSVPTSHLSLEEILNNNNND